MDQYFQDFNAFSGCKAAVDIFFGADLKRDGNRFVNTLADFLNDFPGETGSACYIPAILVFAYV